MKQQIANSKPHDSSSKIIFGNAELCSQFLRNYMDIPLLKNVRAEDIEDVSERYVPMFTEERNSDTVKRVKISEKNTLFFISLIEHKTKVDYNVSMQLLRYMVYIWEDYEKEMEREHKGISKTKDFRYPPILPIVYYEGAERWTAARNFKDRILFDRAFEPFTPKFYYKPIQLNQYSVKELIEKKDELSLVMLINRMQSAEEFRKLNLPKDYLEDLSTQSTDELLGIVERVVATMLRHLEISEDEVAEFTEQVKERKMGELFEHFKNIDLPAARKIAAEEGRAEGLERGRKEGLKEGRKQGLAEGRTEGLAEGEELRLIKMVCKKLIKGRPAPQIAEELEEEVSIIERICQVAETFSPDYDAEKIFNAMNVSNAR
ncbi:MAG: Rpn family recombination-promoting nuclease/putative transposase [Muribaculaceae bacterium]|nr:Rpn family recombination-promoting nuclease/putative transposase [Muribaculaceae bacterium]